MAESGCCNEQPNRIMFIYSFQVNELMAVALGVNAVIAIEILLLATEGGGPLKNKARPGPAGEVRWEFLRHPSQVSAPPNKFGVEFQRCHSSEAQGLRSMNQRYSRTRMAPLGNSY